ncbi:hypothetical protein MKK84_00215 [Methylobacterium sp. E-065]|uniref:hypothetical protein n=1 Tax=Methylobacterium sp. E-065 TaxID=2836583 RepID=UPI001FB8CC9E|nr:hypothetical protein [Methylobacterium sp. E-065]MCJ2015864.1 hypothetical protein [Methylobacterium sp. E-065]
MEAENEYLDLPDDSEEAFAVLHRRKFKELESRWENNEGGNNFYHERQYVDGLVAFDEVHNLGILTAFRDPPTNDRQFSDFFQDCRRVAEVSSQKILMEAARRLKTGASNIVVLDANARQGIHALIEAIREKLNGLSLSENKRESLFSKLNSFASELDRNRTRTEAFYAFAVDTARVAHEVNDEIKPLQQTIDRIFDWLDKAKKLKDALPPWQDRKKIEGPPKRITQSDELDDEIPF